jgi:hypothetical protein
VILGIESLGYFVVAINAGHLFGIDNTLNVQTYFDKKMP